MQPAALNIHAILLSPLPTHTFTTKAVPDLICFFQGPDSALVGLPSSSSSSPTPITTKMTTGRAEYPFPSPFSTLRNSLANSFNRAQRPADPAAFPPSRSSTLPPTSTTMSRRTNSNATFSQCSGATPSMTSTRRSRTWNYTTRANSRSRSPQSLHSQSPILLSRRPSAIDLALLEEESLSHSVREVGLALDLMEPRPVPVVPVAIALNQGHGHGRGSSRGGGSISSTLSGQSSIFDLPIEEEVGKDVEDEDEDDEVEIEIEEQKQPFVMGGIIEVMEGRS